MDWLGALSRQRQLFSGQYAWWQNIRNRPKGFIVLGVDKSGKTSLLKQISNTRLVDKDTGLYSWQLEKQLFIELNADQLDSASHNHGFIRKKIQQYLLRRFIKSIVICIDYQQLRNLADQQQQLESLSKSLQQLQTIIGVLPPQLFLLTKADLINGFNEFFLEYDKQDRRQIWGLSFANGSGSGFNQSFQGLLLNTQNLLMTRLQQTSVQQVRELVLDFPLQLESLKHTVFEHLQRLCTFTKQPVIGFYFTSATQVGEASDRLHQPLNQAFAIEPFKAKTVPHYVKKPFFIHDCFHQLLPNLVTQSQIFRHNSKLWMNRGLFLLGPICLLTGTLFWVGDLNKNLHFMHRLEHGLNMYLVDLQKSQKVGNTLPSLLTALDRLQQSTDQLQHTGKQQQLIQQAKKTYLSALTTKLLPTLQALLEKDLQSKETDPKYLYQSLQAYLMLSDISHFNQHSLLAWIKGYQAQNTQLNMAQNISLYKHSMALLNQPVPAITINESVIKQARKNLLHFARGELLALLIVQSQGLPTAPSPFADKVFDRYFTHDRLHNEIPGLYVPKHLHKVLTQLIPEAAKQAVNGSWILGKLPKSKISSERLTQTVHDLFMMDYMAWWSEHISKLAPKPFVSLHQAEQTLTTLANDKTILTLLTNIRTGTEITEHSELPQPFLALNHLTDPKDQQYILFQTIQQQLRSAAKYVQSIQNDDNRLLAAFNASKKRISGKQTPLSELLQLAGRSPAPLGQWLRQWASNSTQLIFDLGHKHINSLWQSQIIPFYQQRLFARYPLFTDSSRDITISDFEKFFSHQGILNKFFAKNIKPFVNTRHVHWKNKTIDGASIKFNKASLAVFSRGNIISKMFFGNSPSASVTFNLQPLDFYRGLPMVNLQYNQQTITDYPDTPSVHHMHWPTKNPGIRLSLITGNKHQPYHMMGQGEWGLFRLIQSAKLSPSKDPRRYQLTFSHGDQYVKYRLNTAKVINPFMMGVIDDFRCPMVLA